jgi:hypothetical protein
MRDYARAIRELRPKSCILSKRLWLTGVRYTDGLGISPGWPREGFTQAEIDLRQTDPRARSGQ